MTLRRVLVTGAGGFVGSNVAQALLEAGWHVTALDRAFDPDLTHVWQTIWGDRIALVEGEIAASLPDEHVQAVIHGAALTAAPREAGLTPEAHLRANLDPALDLLEWSARHAVQRVILLSSSAVFRATLPGPVDEENPPSPLGLYAVAKGTLEALAETLQVDHERDVVAVRLSSVYGPGERPRPTRPRTSLVGALIQDALRKGTLVVYREDPPREWTFAPDVGRALAALLDQPRLGYPLYHVASAQMLSPLDIARGLGAALPNVSVVVRDGSAPDRSPLTRLGSLGSERLLQDTGFAPWTPFQEGLRHVLHWQRQKMQHDLETNS